MTKDEALAKFEEIIGAQDDFETEWAIFDEFTDSAENLDEADVLDFLDTLIEGLNEDDKTPRKKLKQAAEKAFAFLRSI